MKKLAFPIIMLFCAAAFVQELPNAPAPVKQRIAVLPSVGDLEPQKLILLTDKVREIATKNLPRDNFNVLKQDVIIKLIGEEELYRSCKEGVCIGDLAKKTDANYGARCDVIKVDNRLVLKFELYSVIEEAIFETFTDYNVKDFYGMLATLETRLPSVYKEMVSVLDKALADARDKAIEQQKQETNAQQEYIPTPQPAAPKPPATTLPPVYGQAPKPAPVQAGIPTPTKTTFTDSRDGKVYKKVAIGRQVWMAENLNYNIPRAKTDVCYKKSEDNCAKYGRLYNWNDAMGACPAGWHLPSDAEWTALTDYVGGSKTAGMKLKSTSGWYNNGNGTDEYGFSALPSGYGSSDGYFSNVGNYGGWWSATEGGTNYAFYRYMNYYGHVLRDGNGKAYLNAVRCLQD